MRAGEIVGLAGLVGSGRSELAQTLFGVRPAESGEIRLMGETVTIRSPAEARRPRHRLRARRPQRARAGSADERAAQSVAGGAFDASRASASSIASPSGGSPRHAVEQFGVKTRSLDEVVGRLSGGNQQKIVFGKWLANKPRLLILDEPTRGIDVGAKAEIHRLMGELARAGVSDPDDL